MVMHGNREGLLRALLADDVLVEEFLDLAGGGDRAEQRLGAGELAFFLADDVVRQVDAVGADVDVGGAFDHRADVPRRFSTEGTGSHASSSKPARGVVRVSGRGTAPATTVAGATIIRNRLAFIYYKEVERRQHVRVGAKP